MLQLVSSGRRLACLVPVDLGKPKRDQIDSYAPSADRKGTASGSPNESLLQLLLSLPAQVGWTSMIAARVVSILLRAA
jgi:hypothetical protein